MPKIVLHQWQISPFCGKVRRILAHKQLEFSVEDYPGLTALRAKDLTDVGKLPVLDYDGQRIADSTAIAEFLEQRHREPPLYPLDPVARARAHFFEDWADESLYWFEVYFRMADPGARKRAAGYLCEGRSAPERMLFERVLGRMYRGKLKAQGIGRMDEGEIVKRFEEHLDGLEALLGSMRFLIGNVLTIADIAVASQLAEIQRTSPLRHLITQRASVSEWLGRIPDA